MVVYEKNNKLNINFNNSIEEVPNIRLGENDNNKTDIEIDGKSLNDSLLTTDSLVETTSEMTAEQKAEAKANLGIIDATTENIVSATAAMTPAQAAQTRQNIGADTPATVTEWLDEHVNPDTGYVIDDTLTIQGAAADAKATGDAVGELKSALRFITKTTPVDVTPTTNNKAIKNSDGTIVDAGSVSYYVSNELNVTKGEKYKISLTMHLNNAVVAFYNAGGTFISSIPATQGTASGSNYTFTDYEFTVPANAKTMRIGFYTYVFTVVKVYEDVSAHPAWYGKKWACLGDSLTAANTATTKHYFDYVAEDTGIVPVNLGVNGTGYARSSGSGEAFYNRIDTIPTDSDVVTIFGSFNDIGSGLEFGDVDNTGTTTIAGCINTTITNLQTRIPLVNLGIVAPTPWDTTRPNFVPTSNSYKYVNLLKMICERRSIPFLDLWHCSNLRPWDADFRAIAYSKDNGSGTHPDENGHKLIAPRFEWFLSSLMLG